MESHSNSLFKMNLGIKQVLMSHIGDLVIKILK